MRTNDVREALAQYRAALDIDRELTSVDPGNSQAVLDLSFSETKVGSHWGNWAKREKDWSFCGAEWRGRKP